MRPKPQFIQGIFPFEGAGLQNPTAVPDTGYTVPKDKRAQLVYLRLGNTCDELITLVLTLDGKRLRLFPIGAKASMHVPLTVVEDLAPESRLEVLIAAPAGLKGEAVLDVGLLEVD